MDKIGNGIVTIFSLLIGVAIIATLVSKNAQTGEVIGAVTKGFAGDLSAAVSPVTGLDASSYWSGYSGGGNVNAGHIY